MHIIERPGASKDDLLSRLAPDWIDGREITFESLVHQVMGLIVAGSGATRTAPIRLTSRLLEPPDDWAALRPGPTPRPRRRPRGAALPPAGRLDLARGGRAR